MATEDAATLTSTNEELTVMETNAISTREATTMTGTIFDALEEELKETLKLIKRGADERVKFYTGLPSSVV